MPYDAAGNDLEHPARGASLGVTREVDDTTSRYERSRKRLGWALLIAALLVTVWVSVGEARQGRTRDLPAWPVDANSSVSQIRFSEGCGDETRVAFLEETATEVRIRIEGKGINENDCEQVLVVPLERELGGREIVDLVTGQRFRADNAGFRGYVVVDEDP